MTEYYEDERDFPNEPTTQEEEQPNEDLDICLLDRLRTYCQECSVGPWRWEKGTNKLLSAGGNIVLAFDTSNLANHPCPEDRRFIHAASTWMASLISEVYMTRCSEKGV